MRDTPQDARARAMRKAAPAGGACDTQGRGCLHLADAGALIPVPSGQAVTFTEVIMDDQPGETWARFRFMAPDIARSLGRIDPETVMPDMDYLCEAVALPYLQQAGLKPARVIISLSDRPVPFGATDAEATQFFEAYRPEKGRCIWEGF